MVKLDSFSPVSQFNASCKVAYFNGKWDLSQVHRRLGRLQEGSKLLWWCEGIWCFRVLSVHPLHSSALVTSNCRLYLALYTRINCRIVPPALVVSLLNWFFTVLERILWLFADLWGEWAHRVCLCSTSKHIGNHVFAGIFDVLDYVFQAIWTGEKKLLFPFPGQKVARNVVIFVSKYTSLGPPFLDVVREILVLNVTSSYWVFLFFVFFPGSDSGNKSSNAIPRV